ncbi:RdgB/HAM1 family non-canonical purine NTP pyrophosphatase [Bacteroidetes/Chlorobi group bacterium ChocPot_Mid]|nr:MAG: RdgB/HAM1 family non-canonical purine NTP pyrophosphatase [Bacteroidetes/Chlorobi group bacterium ChocPot_Mid]
MILLLGSNNKHKASEVRQILDEVLKSQYTLKILSEVLDEFHDVVEDGETLEENAYKKAKEYFELAKIPCFADDTGLEIDALNGLPGVKSARFAGEDCIDKNNRTKVLQLMDGLPEEQRTARFRTVICYFDGANAKYVEGICSGRIISEERGTNGFGYDSIFVPEGYERTFAEMQAEEKNAISHRGKAIRNFAKWLKTKKD